MKSNTPINSPNDLAIDVQGVTKLRTMAKQNSAAALKETSKQFEALFINMMLKSMRQATPDGGLFDSHERPIYTSMLDQQLSQNLAQKGIGLSDMLVAQLIKADPSLAAADNSELQHTLRQPLPLYKKTSPLTMPVNLTDKTAADDLIHAAKSYHEGSSASNFTNQMQGHAQQAEQLTGVPASFILAQAALESGWGKREITLADGSSSHNVFGIKADKSWKGPVAEISSTEYIDGEPKLVQSKFRVYGSHAEAFQDYALFLANNPRYKHVLANSQSAQDFAQGIQQAGYATDPAYADKLVSIIQRVEAG